MRRAMLVVAALVAGSAWASESRAQNGGYSDPFFLYYSYFLPRQAALAAQPNVNDSINAAVADRQSYASTNRESLYDPNGGYGAFDGYDPNAVFNNPTQRGRGTSRQTLQTRGLPTTNIRGRGPALYYNRAAQYYPGLRNGQGPNHNLAVGGKGASRPGGSGGGGGFGGFGVPNAYSGLGSGISPR